MDDANSVSRWQRLRSRKTSLRLLPLVLGKARGNPGGPHADQAQAVRRQSDTSQQGLPGWVGGLGASRDDANVQLRLMPPTPDGALTPSCIVRDVSTGKEYHAGAVTISQLGGREAGSEPGAPLEDETKAYGALFPSDFPDVGHVRSGVFEVRWSKNGSLGPTLLADPYLFELWNGELVAWVPAGL